MAKWTHNGPCNNCGSKDNLGHWDDGSMWCWGCSFYKPPIISPYAKKALEEDDDYEREEKVVLPSDWTQEFPQEAIEWFNKYDIYGHELIKNKVVWSPSKQQVIFTWYQDDGTLLAYNARNFWKEAKTKYYSKGNLNNLLPIYYYSKSSKRSQVLVIVEDCLSAIKISRYTDAMPALSSDVSLDKINRLARLYDTFLVWLDGDMYHKAQRISDRFLALGCNASTVYTPKDPKTYSNEDIKVLTLV